MGIDFAQVGYLNYCGQANICMLMDREVLKDGWVLFDYFVDELNELVALTKQ